MSDSESGLVEVPVEADIVVSAVNDKVLINKKLALCAVNLGARIIKEMIGDSISKVNTDQEISELIAAAMLAELNL